MVIRYAAFVGRDEARVNHHRTPDSHIAVVGQPGSSWNSKVLPKLPDQVAGTPFSHILDSLNFRKPLPHVSRPVPSVDILGHLRFIDRPETIDRKSTRLNS